MSTVTEQLKEALDDIDAYLETMPKKTDDWSIGDTSTPFVKSLRLLREQFEGRGEVISELTQEFDAIAEAVASKGKEPLSETVQTIAESLREIGQIIEAVDYRCMAADGPVTPTLQEMTQKEMSRIYELTQPTVPELRRRSSLPSLVRQKEIDSLRADALTPEEAMWVQSGWLNHNRRFGTVRCACVKCEDLAAKLRSLGAPE